MRQIVLERFAVMQVDVETDEVDVLRVEKLRGRKRREGAQTLRFHRPRSFHQFLNEISDGTHANPANDLGRDFVHHAVSEDAGMPWPSLTALCTASRASCFNW